MLKLTLSFAQSLDACIATKTGESKWISCHETLVFAHEQRQAHDAIMVGSGTVKIDNPQLSVRLAHPVTRQPLRVILDSELSTDPESLVYQNQAQQKTLIFTRRASRDRDETRGKFEKKGIEIVEVSGNSSGLDLKEVLSKLEERGIQSMFVEGGSGLITSIIRQGLFSKIYLVIAPVFIGGGKKALGDLSIETLADAPRYELIGTRTIGTDIVLEIGPRSGEVSPGGL